MISIYYSMAHDHHLWRVACEGCINSKLIRSMKIGALHTGNMSIGPTSKWSLYIIAWPLTTIFGGCEGCINSKLTRTMKNRGPSHWQYDPLQRPHCIQNIGLCTVCALCYGTLKRFQVAIASGFQKHYDLINTFSLFFTRESTRCRIFISLYKDFYQ